MKCLPPVLALAFVFSLSAPAWSAESLTQGLKKAKDATVETFGKAKDATVDTFGKAKDATAETWDKVRGKDKSKEPGNTALREFPATVRRVTDGNTIVVRTNDARDIKVRLYGIDAPESKQEGGAESAAALKPLQGQMVVIRGMSADQSGETAALVEHNGKSVNLDQVARGRAWFHPQNCKEQPVCSRIKAAEEEARAARKGLWAKQPEPPWEWRKKK